MATRKHKFYTSSLRRSAFMVQSIPRSRPKLGPQPAHSVFYVPHQVTLKIQEHVVSISGDDFTIYTNRGRPICKCNGEVASYRQAKDFIDLDGKAVFTLNTKLVSLRKTFVGKSAEGSDFTIKAGLRCVGSKSMIAFQNGDGSRQVELEIIGDWKNRTAEIWHEYAKRTKRTFTAREILAHTSKQYALSLLSGAQCGPFSDCCYLCMLR